MNNLEVGMTEKGGLPDALKPHMFKAGCSGGPGKTPGRALLRTVLRKVLEIELDLDNPVTRETYKMSVSEAIALKLVKRALDGNLRAIELIFDRVEGKVADMLQLGTMDDKPLEIGNTLKYDFSNLSVDELLFVRGILKKTANNDAE